MGCHSTKNLLGEDRDSLEGPGGAGLGGREPPGTNGPDMPNDLHGLDHDPRHRNHHTDPTSAGQG